MTRSTLLASLVVASLGGCVQEPFRPVATARDLGTDVLACDDVEVFAAPSETWGADPLAGTSSTYMATGCGQRAWFRCSAKFSVGGGCTPLPLGPYVSPAPDQPHALLVTEVLNVPPTNAGARELLVIDQQGWVARRAGRGMVGVPLRAGPTEIELGAQPMRRETRRHTRLRSRTKDEYTTDVHGNRVERQTTEYFTEHYTTTHMLTGAGCASTFQLHPRPGAIYRVQLDYGGAGQCQVACVQETRVQGRTVRSDCEGFGPR